MKTIFIEKDRRGELNEKILKLMFNLACNLSYDEFNLTTIEDIIEEGVSKQYLFDETKLQFLDLALELIQRTKSQEISISLMNQLSYLLKSEQNFLVFKDRYGLDFILKMFEVCQNIEVSE